MSTYHLQLANIYSKMNVDTLKSKIIDVDQLQMFKVKLPEEKHQRKVQPKRILSFHEAFGPILTG